MRPPPPRQPGPHQTRQRLMRLWPALLVGFLALALFFAVRLTSGPRPVEAGPGGGPPEASEREGDRATDGG